MTRRKRSIDHAATQQSVPHLPRTAQALGLVIETFPPADDYDLTPPVPLRDDGDEALRRRDAPVPDDNEGGVQRLRGDQKFVEFVKENLWDSRRDRGLPYRMDVFDFIRKYYSDWISKGLTRSDLKALDESLWWALQNRLRGGIEMPTDIYIPTEPEAELASIQDAEERTKVLEQRALWRRINELRKGP